MRTVEAFLAILLLFSAFAITTLVSPTSKTENDETLATMGMQTLVSMDVDGKLGGLVDDRNWTTFSEALRMQLPVGVSYNLTVYDENQQRINSVSISNSVTPNQNVVSVQYPCASPSGKCYLLRLELAEAW